MKRINMFIMLISMMLVSYHLLIADDIFLADEIKEVKVAAEGKSILLNWSVENDSKEISKFEILQKYESGHYRKVKELENENYSCRVENISPLEKVFFKVRIVFGNRHRSIGKEVATYLKDDNLFADKCLDKKLAIYLPESYGKSNKKYPVVYMLDGQNLFTTEYTNHSWKADIRLKELVDSKLVKEAIIVGVYHAGDLRGEEYIPYLYDKGKYFAEYFVKELIPYIENKYQVLSGRENRCIIGSSMGATMALYLFENYNNYFSMVASMSVHDRWGINELKKTKKTDSKLWISSGGEETFGAIGNGFYSYLDTSKTITQIYMSKGYVLGTDIFLYHDIEGIHDEDSWSKQLKYPLTMFLSEKNPEVSKIEIYVDVTRKNNGKIANIINPIAICSNGLKYSLYSEAKYSITSGAKIDSYGEFDLGNLNEADVKIDYKGISTTKKVLKKDVMLLTEKLSK